MLQTFILVWDQMQNVSFKWINFEMNTLVPYNDEIMFENSLMLSQNSKIMTYSHLVCLNINLRLLLF